jgi:hypothetical protein
MVGLRLEGSGVSLADGTGLPLGVVEPREMRPLREHAGGRNDRACQWTHTHLIDPGHHQRAFRSKTGAQPEQSGEAPRLALEITCAAQTVHGQPACPLSRIALERASQPTQCARRTKR